MVSQERLPENLGKDAASFPHLSLVEAPEVQYSDSEVRVARSVGVVNTDSRALVVLAVAHGGATKPHEVRDILNERNLDDEPAISNKQARKLMEELTYEGVLSRSGFNRSVGYKIRPESEVLVSDVGYFADVSSRSEIPLIHLFGQSELGYTYPELHSAGGYPHDRIRILQYINTLFHEVRDDPLTEGAAVTFPFSTAQMSEDLSIHKESIRQHLRSLNKNGLIDLRAVNTSNGSFMQYQPVVIYEEPIIRSKRQPSIQTSLVSEYIHQARAQRLSAGGAVSYALEAEASVDGLLSKEVAIFKQKIRDSFYKETEKRRMKHLGIFSEGEYAHLVYEPKSLQDVAIKEMTEALTMIQSNDPGTIKKGSRLGDKVINDDEDVTHLLRKVRRVGGSYSSTQTP